MSQLVRMLAVVMGSKWLLPVSFIVGLMVGMHWAARLDERPADKGTEPHSQFMVVWQPGEAGKPFGVSYLKDIARVKAMTPARSFIMEKSTGETAPMGERYRTMYKVVSSDASGQLIEVADIRGDRVIRSRYRATPSDVTPESSGGIHPGQMFMAVLPAIGFAVVIYQIGKWLRRRVAGKPG